MFNPETPPALMTTGWLNSREPVTLEGLRGQVIVLLAFQMLCPGCVSHALPLMRKLQRQFNGDDVAVIGLHTVFEHHAAMTPAALEAFLHEYQWSFPIGIDAPDGTGRPKTMAAYDMQGTPTVLLFDRQGRLRRHYLGQVDDVRLAAEVMGLAMDDADSPREVSVRMEHKILSVLRDPAGDHEHGHHHHDDACGCGHDHAPHGPTAASARARP